MCVYEEFSSLFAFSPFLPLPSFLPPPLSSFFQTGFHVAKTVFQLLILLPPLPLFTTTPDLCYSGGGTQDFTRLACSLYPLSHILSPGKIPYPAKLCVRGRGGEVVPELELRTMCMPGKGFTTKLHLQPSSLLNDYT